MIRDVLLGAYTLGWLVVVVITAARNNGTVPAELWTVLGFGVGALLALFRVDDKYGDDKKPGRHRQEPQDEESGS